MELNTVSLSVMILTVGTKVLKIRRRLENGESFTEGEAIPVWEAKPGYVLKKRALELVTSFAPIGHVGGSVELSVDIEVLKGTTSLEVRVKVLPSVCAIVDSLRPPVVPVGDGDNDSFSAAVYNIDTEVLEERMKTELGAIDDGTFSAREVG